MINRQNGNFTIVLNDIVNNKGLSAKAKGIYLYLQSKADGWQFYESEIINNFSDGRDSIRAGVKELIKAKLLLKYQDKTTGKFNNVLWILNPTVDDYRQYDTTVDGKPADGNPDDVKTADVKPPSNKTNNNNTNSKKNKERKEEEEEIPFFNEYLEFITEGYKGVKRPKAFRKAVEAKYRNGDSRTLENYNEFIEGFASPKEIDITTLKDFTLDLGFNTYQCLSAKEIEEEKIEVIYEGATGLTSMSMPKATFFKGLK